MAWHNRGVNFVAVLDRVDRALAAAGFRSAVVGGVALAAYGSPRLTIDLDLVTPQLAQPVIIPALEQWGYQTLFRSPGFSNHQHAESEWGRVDFIYINDTTAARLFAEARDLAGPVDRRICVPSPEHLIAMKVQAMANDPRRTRQDLADIEFLMSLAGVDRAVARSYFEKANLLERWNELDVKP